MAIGLDKILTMSASDYCEIKGTQLKDYEAVGVHLRSYRKEKTTESLRDCIPPGTEVVVGYISSISRYLDTFALFESGTALIPKTETEKESIYGIEKQKEMVLERH